LETELFQICALLAIWVRKLGALAVL